MTQIRLKLRKDDWNDAAEVSGMRMSVTESGEPVCQSQESQDGRERGKEEANDLKERRVALAAAAASIFAGRGRRLLLALRLQFCETVFH